jgi:thiamine pyrophosphate-dependent acetolactate synthase large subunit-like protein
MLFHEAFGRTLAHVTDTVFGVLGDGNLFLIDSYRQYGGGRFLSMANEGGAVLAANGYANVTGRLGVATVTHGPGLTNTVTALVEAVRSRSATLVIAGDTAPSVRDHIQGINQQQVVESSGAIFEQVHAVRTFIDDLGRAARTALQRQLPVVLNVPADLQWAEVDVPLVPPKLSFARQAIAPDPEALDRAVGVIAASRRPILLVGRGAGRPATRTALLKFADRLGAPIATTLRAKDLFRGETFDLGVMGTVSHEVAADTIQRSDCIIAVGASLNQWTTVNGGLLNNRAVVQIDSDPNAFAFGYNVEVAVVGDSTAVIEHITAMLDEGDIEPRTFASSELAAALAVVPPVPDLESTPGTVNMHAAVARLDAALPPDRTVVLDAGRFLSVAFTGMRVPEPRAFIPTMNFASIGLATATGVGAGVGKPDCPTVVICGDGGFMMDGVAEFNSAVRHGVDLIVVVLNDGAYGAEHIQFTTRDMDPVITTFQWPEFAPVADALGGTGYTVRNADDLEHALAALPSRSGPVLLDIKIDPYKAAPPAGH